MNILNFPLMKASKEKISMVTCYDFWSAQILNQTDVDSILVGDSLAMVMHGFPSTVHATVDMMATHIAAVRRGAPDKFIVGDMPFMQARYSQDVALEGVAQLMRAGSNAVKIEGAAGQLDLMARIVESGVPVMGHLGLTPQSIYRFGSYNVRAKENLEAKQLLKEIIMLEKIGCFGVVLEKIPASLAEKATKSIKIPTIGIGAGKNVDGQVLVLHLSLIHI